MAEKKHRIGGDFTIRNLENVSSQHTLVDIEQSPMKLNNPPPGVLRGSNIPYYVSDGSPAVSEPPPPPPPSIFLEEFVADNVSWDAITIPTPDFTTSETTWTEDFESDWT